MNNYQPNSHKFKQEQQEAAVEKKKTGKVIKGTATVKKKNEIQKFADVFISEDAANVKDYILMDLLIPGLKKLTVSIIKSAAEIIFGETGLDRRSDSSGRVPYVSYNDYSRRKDDRRHTESRARTGYRFEDVVLETRGEAERVLDLLHEKLAEYGTVSVAELYEAVGLSSEYTDYNYGWTKLRDAEPSRLMGGGYTLNLPRPIPLK